MRLGWQLSLRAGSRWGSKVEAFEVLTHILNFSSSKRSNSSSTRMISIRPPFKPEVSFMFSILSPSDSQRSLDVFSLQAHVEEDSLPEFEEALSETTNATKALVTKFMKASGPETPLSRDDQLQKLQRSQAEVRPFIRTTLPYVSLSVRSVRIPTCPIRSSQKTIGRDDRREGEIPFRPSSPGESD